MMTGSIDEMRQIDLDYRPSSYFWPMSLTAHLLSQITGAERRAALQRLLRDHTPAEIPEILAKGNITVEERTALGSIHPAFMGGEYLPAKSNQEVEIATIEIASTTFDVTGVYAGKTKSSIAYRVVDEYDG